MSNDNNNSNLCGTATPRQGVQENYHYHYYFPNNCNFRSADVLHPQFNQQRNYNSSPQNTFHYFGDYQIPPQSQFPITEFENLDDAPMRNVDSTRSGNNALRSFTSSGEVHKSANVHFSSSTNNNTNEIQGAVTQSNRGKISAQQTNKFSKNNCTGYTKKSHGLDTIHADKTAAYIPGRQFLNYLLKGNPHKLPSFKIEAQEILSFGEKVDSKKLKFASVMHEFSKVIDKWTRQKPKEEEVMALAKSALLIAYKFGNQGIRSLSGIFTRRLQQCEKNEVNLRLRVVYLTYLIMGLEKANYPNKGNLLVSDNIQFMLSQQKTDVFRKLVAEVPQTRKQELYALRCLLEPFFSQKALSSIDRGNFWGQQKVSQAKNGESSQCVNKLNNKSTHQQNSQAVRQESSESIHQQIQSNRKQHSQLINQQLSQPIRQQNNLPIHQKNGQQNDKIIQQQNGQPNRKQHSQLPYQQLSQPIRQQNSQLTHQQNGQRNDKITRQQNLQALHLQNMQSILETTSPGIRQQNDKLVHQQDNQSIRQQRDQPNRQQNSHPIRQQNTQEIRNQNDQLNRHDSNLLDRQASSLSLLYRQENILLNRLENSLLNRQGNKQRTHQPSNQSINQKCNPPTHHPDSQANNVKSKLLSRPLDNLNSKIQKEHDNQVIETKCKGEKVVDQVKESIEMIIEKFLKVDDVMVDFPLEEKTKRRLTEKYSVAKASGKDAVYLYGKVIEFNMIHIHSAIISLILTMEKKRFVDVAKEAFFVENMFGNDKTVAVADLLIARMAGRSKPNGKPNELSVESRLAAVFLIHIILCAEAIQSLHVFKPKITRPYSKAFATEFFVDSFRDLVIRLQDRGNRRQLFYWMRLVWNSCLPDEYLLKIDDNKFWGSSGIQDRALPTYLHLKKRVLVEVPDDENEEIAIIAQIDKSKVREDVATVVLQSSDDEDDNEDEGVHAQQTAGVIHSTICESNINSVTNAGPETNVPREKDYEKIFHQYRNNWWPKWFSMHPYSSARLQEKYCFERGPFNNLILALSTFRKTVYDIFSSVDEERFLEAAKEAFTLHSQFGNNAVNLVADFLVETLKKGFHFYNASVSSLCSRLVALLLIHIIIAVENVEPEIVPNTTQKWFFKAFEDRKAISNVENLVECFSNDEFGEKIEFLVLTWHAYGRDDQEKTTCSSDVNKVYEKNCFMEAAHIINIIKYIKGKYDENKLQFDGNKIPPIAITKNHKRKIEEVLIDDNETDVETLKTDNINVNASEASSLPAGLKYTQLKKTNENDGIDKEKSGGSLSKKGKYSHAPIESHKIITIPPSPEYTMNTAEVDEVQVIEDVNSDEFVNNLLMGNLEIVFTDKGAQVKKTDTV